jgi:hypothetical protein
LCRHRRCHTRNRLELKGGFFLKRIAAVLTILGATFAFAAPAMAAPSLCLTAHVDVNGTVQDVNQCLPA